MSSPGLIIPINESERLEAVYRYDILDTPPDGAFDRVTALAARFFNVPISIVSIVDYDRIWFKSHKGVEVNQIGREPGLCASAILQEDVYAVLDAKLDPRTLANPLVAGEFGLQFYAAAPLITSKGYKLGTICVIDCQPRQITAAEKETLKDLAAIVIDELELRITAKQTVEKEVFLRQEIFNTLEMERELSQLRSQLVSMISHEFRTPLSTILSSTELIEYYSDKLTDQKKSEHFHKIKVAIKKLLQLMNETLLIGKAEAGKLDFVPNHLDLIQFCQSLVSDIQVIAGSNYKLNFVNSGNCQNACMDQNLLEHILNNLLLNAIKYSPEGGNIDFELVCKDREAIFYLRDSGIGIPTEEQGKLFNSFHRANNVGNISGTGLGLAIVKNCVALHQGEITVESEVGVGTTFIVTLPLHSMKKKPPQMLSSLASRWGRSRTLNSESTSLADNK